MNEVRNLHYEAINDYGKWIPDEAHLHNKLQPSHACSPFPQSESATTGGLVTGSPRNCIDPFRFCVPGNMSRFTTGNTRGIPGAQIDSITGI